MKLHRFITIAAILILSIIVFSACEGPTGPEGLTGPIGPAGGAITVWDSSSPPQFIGYHLGYETLTKNEYVISISHFSGLLYINGIICFTGVDGTGSMVILGSSSYPNFARAVTENGNTFYIASGHGSIMEIKSSINDDGDIVNHSHTGFFIPIREISRAEVGLPDTITPPLILKVAQ